MATRVPVGKVVDIIGKGRESADKVGREVRVDVLVDPRVPRWIALAVKGDLTPLQPASRVSVMALGEEGPVGGEVDACVVLAGGSERALRAAVRAYVGAGVPTAVVAESSLDVPEIEVAGELASYYTLLAASEREALDEGLAEWLIGSTDKHVTMAANFAFCRKAEAERLINRCALENAAVGAVDIIHGADLPIMVGNQLKLLFDVAAANGRGLEAWRLPEAAGVIAAGLFYRAITRSLVSHAPVGKFAVRAAMGYAGTVATGAGIQAVFAAAEGTLPSPSSLVPSWLVGLVRLGMGNETDDGSRTHDGSTQELPVIGRAPWRDDGDDQGFGYLSYQPDGTVR